MHVEDTGEGATASVGATVPYDRFVQLGTRNMEPQPYGQEAAEGAPLGVVSAMTAVYKAALPG